MEYIILHVTTRMTISRPAKTIRTTNRCLGLRPPLHLRKFRRERQFSATRPTFILTACCCCCKYHSFQASTSRTVELEGCRLAPWPLRLLGWSPGGGAMLAAKGRVLPVGLAIGVGRRASRSPSSSPRDKRALTRSTSGSRCPKTLDRHCGQRSPDRACSRSCPLFSALPQYSTRHLSCNSSKFYGYEKSFDLLTVTR